MSGITYYKLNPITHGYEGDTVKNCGLTGGEVDGNFNFLRGMDIENGQWDDENKILKLKRFNGDTIGISGISFEIICSENTEESASTEYDDTEIRCLINNLDEKLNALKEIMDTSDVTALNNKFTALKSDVDVLKNGNFSEAISNLNQQVEDLHYDINNDILPKLINHENEINKLLNNG